MEAKVLQQGRATFSIDLHPAYSSNPIEGIKNLLTPRLLRWDNELDGVLLAYKDIQHLPTQAVIRPYFPYIHLKIRADVLVFKPRIGAVLCGHVTKIGADFIGMTVLGTLNAAIGRQHIRPELSYSDQADAWTSPSDPSSSISVGTAVIFAVEGLCIERSGICAIVGSLAESWSGSCKAAALRHPLAFSNPQRWQENGAVADRLAGLSNQAEVLQQEHVSMEKVLQGSRLSSLTTEAAVDPPAGNRLLETKETAERRKIKAKRKVGEVECQELEPHGPAVTSNAEDGQVSPEMPKKKKKKRKDSLLKEDPSVDALSQPELARTPAIEPSVVPKGEPKRKEKKSMEARSKPEPDPEALLGREPEPQPARIEVQEGEMARRKKKKKKRHKKEDQQVLNGVTASKGRETPESGQEERPVSKQEKKERKRSKEGGPSSVNVDLSHALQSGPQSVGASKSMQSPDVQEIKETSRSAERKPKKKAKSRLSTMTS